eukprot:SAG22_NODE_106_length_19904_cov_14.387175_15_plen_335_part_00
MAGAPAPASLEELIGLAMRGDPRALMHLETSATDANTAAEALLLLTTTQGVVAHFAGTLLVRHARTGRGGDLGELCAKCLQLALGVQQGNQQLVIAAAAAAVRHGNEAAAQVHSEAMRVIREAGAAANWPAVVAGFQLARSVAGEAGRPAVPPAVAKGLRAHLEEMLQAVQWALAQAAAAAAAAGGGGGADQAGLAKLQSNALECLKQWSEAVVSRQALSSLVLRLGLYLRQCLCLSSMSVCLSVLGVCLFGCPQGFGLDLVLQVDGLLPAVCAMVGAHDAMVVDEVADLLDVLTAPSPSVRSMLAHTADLLRRSVAGGPTDRCRCTLVSFQLS